MKTIIIYSPRYIFLLLILATVKRDQCDASAHKEEVLLNTKQIHYEHWRKCTSETQMCKMFKVHKHSLSYETL